MANKEMYDYLSVATPDKDITLNVTPQHVLIEGVSFDQVIHRSDDGSGRSVSSYADSPVITVKLQWDEIDESDSGTIFDIYTDTAKAFGCANTFKWSHPTDGHTYVVAFAAPLQRSQQPASRFAISQITLDVVGRIADA